MKSRELLKRIRKTALGEEQGGFGAFNEEMLEGTEVTASHVLDAAQSLSLGGGVRLIVVRDAHAIKEAESLSPLLGPAQKKDQLTSVCVFLSKDLDGRKKFSKLLTEKAAVVPCEDVPEEEREAWIGYLGKKRGLNLPEAMVAGLRGLDPWSLDIVDLELSKFEVSGDADVVLGGAGQIGADRFLDSFFRREKKLSLEAVEQFADHMDQALPLLGLFAWNVRHLAQVVSDREKGIRSTKLSPFLAERFHRWSRSWKLEEVIGLQSALAEVDFGIKQTPKLPLGLWTSFVSRFT
jgi:DNA polymerase III delta subunit